MTRPNKPLARNFDSPKLCGGKRCYLSRHAAEMVVEEKKILQPELELAIYRCSSCGDFHLTRQNASNTS